MALRDQFMPAGVWDRLTGMTLEERDVPALADVAPGVPGPEAAAFLLRYLGYYADTRDNQIRYVYHVARYGPPGSEAPLLAFARGDRAAGLAHHVALFKAVQQGTQARGVRLGADARDWGEGLARRLIASNNDKEVVAGLELGGSLKMASMHGLLERLAGDEEFPEVQRGAALGALLALDGKWAIPVLGRVVGDSAAPQGLREKAADLLAKTNQPEGLAALLQALPTAPGSLARVLANGLSNSQAGAEQLLDRVAAGNASARLLQDPGVQLRLFRHNLPRARERVARLTHGLPTAEQQFEGLLKRRRAGYLAAHKDPARGARVFEKSCAVCHTLANKGAKIGPQLDGIGARGFDRLVEDILDPNRNVDQAFRVTTLGLTNGQVVSGLLLREEGQVYVMADGEGKEVRVPRASVEDRTLSQLSPMPANFADQIPEADFYDLLAYLLAQQPAKGNGAAGR
jgi:putative heme-binding domain-containing protein